MFAKDFNTTAVAMMNGAREAGFHPCPAAPLSSAFWVPTFAPSSTEVLFRELASRQKSVDVTARLCTIQPCLRLNDIAPWSDGFHLPYFTLFTCFVIGFDDPLHEVQKFFDVLKGVGIPVERSCFTYFDGVPPQGAMPLVAQFNETFLKRLDIGSARLVPCAGTANYEFAKRLDDAGREYLIYGPKIEVFDSGNTNIEYSTLIYSHIKMSNDAKPSVPILQMGAGVERSTLVRLGLKSVWQLDAMCDLKSTVMHCYLKEGGRSLLSHDVEHALELVLTLLRIARETPEVSPGSKSVRAQLRRVIRATAHKTKHIGLPVRGVLGSIKNQSVGEAFSGQEFELVGRWLESESIDP